MERNNLECNNLIKKKWKKLQENNKAPRAITGDFSKYETFERFVNFYEGKKPKIRSDIVSVPFFSLLLKELTEKYTDVSICTQYPVKYCLKVNGNKEIIHKFDICICVGSRKKIFVDVKKCIDLILGDLFYALLRNTLSRDKRQSTEQVKIIEFIWEETNNSKYKNGEDSRWMVFLNYFKGRGLDKFYYFYRDKNDEVDARDNFGKAIHGLKKFLKDEIEI